MHPMHNIWSHCYMFKEDGQFILPFNLSSSVFDDKPKIAVRNSTWNQMNVMNPMEATFLAMEKKYVKVVN